MNHTYALGTCNDMSKNECQRHKKKTRQDTQDNETVCSVSDKFNLILVSKFLFQAKWSRKWMRHHALQIFIFLYYHMFHFGAFLFFSFFFIKMKYYTTALKVQQSHLIGWIRQAKEISREKKNDLPNLDWIDSGFRWNLKISIAIDRIK